MSIAERTIRIGEHSVAPGTRQSINLPVATLYTHTPVEMPVHVINGRRNGPRLFVSAAIHGDELNGIEIIRRLLKVRMLNRLRGSLIAVPILNIFGVLSHSRYLPDRRDLNRSFPGTDKGSLAARLADLVMREIVSQCTHGIDLHTGALHRSNLPQIRANLDDAETERLARAFSVPVLLNSDVRDGSLRQAAAEHGIPMLLYEAGEALRFDEQSIHGGLAGIVNVMRSLEMLPRTRKGRHPHKEPVVARSSFWVRAPNGGILRTHVALGEKVEKTTLLASISDPFGNQETALTSPYGGIVIGRSSLPLVNEGDAVFHIARFSRPTDAARAVEAFEETPLMSQDDALLEGEPEIR
ncbi:MAG: succinylglutamate desuccinylase/aspartoacylase family protein [Gammaproteobacteria bacterium]|jgi:predicted deacylase